MRGKANWIKRMTTLLLCAVLLLRCGVFVMPSALAEEGEAPAETTLCETCGANPCTCDDEPILCETCGEATCVCESEATPAAEDYSDSVNKYARLNDYYSDGYVLVHDGSDSFDITSALFFEYAEFEEGLTFLITDWYLDSVSSALWYQVEAYEGTLPEGMSDGYWILQNYTNENADEDTLLFVTVEEPDEPEIPSVEAPVTDSEGNELTDSEGNPITITVSGEALPDGAQVVATVPTVNGEPLEGVYDIKVLVDGVKWQPIDCGEMVTVTIPVNIDKICTGVLHFIDYADAIDGDETIISTEGVNTAELVPFQAAIDAYGDSVHIATEILAVVQEEGGLVSFETDSFSLYTPDYEIVAGNEFTITFTSTTGVPDVANEHTYYAPIGQKINFKTEWNQGENWSITTLKGTATETIDDLDSGDWVQTGDNWWDREYDPYSSCSVTFNADGIEVGDIFQIDWVTNWSVLDGKQPRWTRVMIVGEYPTTFLANGGTFSDSSTTLEKTVVSYQPVDMVEQPTRDGYIFGGWSAVPNAVVGDVIYSLTDKFPATLPTNTTFYAQWEPMQYTVTYVVPENSTNKSLFVSQTKNYGIDLKLNSTTPLVDDDTVFQYWIGSDGKTYKPGDTYTGNEDLTLVGLWDDAVYTLVYNANGGTDAPMPQYLDTSETDSRELTIATQIPNRPGYSFVEWKDEDGKTYDPGDTITLSSSVTLYAQWNIIPYTIAFGANGGSGSMDSMTSLYYEDNFSDANGKVYANLTANTFTKKGFTFEGWSLTDGDNDVLYTNGQNVKVSDLVDAAVKVGQTGSTITLHAVWAEGTYKIIYEPGASTNDVTITNPSQTVIINKAKDTHINSSAQRTNYTFAGWTDKDGNIYEYGEIVPQSATNNDEITLTAIWTIEVAGYIYTLVDGSYSLDGTITVDGTDYPGSYVEPDVTEGGNVSAMIFTPSEGHEISRIVVDGVEQTVENTSCYYHPARETVSASSVVVVITVPITYTVTFVDWDGTVLDTQTVTHGSAATAPADPARDDYTFIGWSADFSKVTSDLTVTAQYEQDTIVSVTITWSNLTFVYTQGDWDPQTHTYGAGSFAPENATITVENSKDSTLTVNAAISYEANEDYKDIKAQFSIGETGTQADTAEADVAIGNTVVFYLWLSGRLDDLSQSSITSGTCTVTITAASSAANSS